MRHFLFSSAIVSSVATGGGLLRRTLQAPLSWQTWLLWVSWAISLALSVAGVVERSKEAQLKRFPARLPTEVNISYAECDNSSRRWACNQNERFTEISLAVRQP